MKRLAHILISILFSVTIAGCSVSEASEQPTRLVAYSEKENFAVHSASVAPIPAVSEDLAPTASPSPTPTVSAQSVELPEGAIPQLYLNGNFMRPKSLDGIDPLNDKVVALTFDDGPHKTNTDKLLNILAQNGAVATFFMLGENIEKYPEVVKRVYDAGNEIGTHSYDHADLRKLTVEQIMSEQFGRTNDALEKIIGVRATFDRPPYGGMTDELLAQIGREQIMWNVDPEDWKTKYKSTAALMDNIFNGTNTGIKVSDGSIILSHDIHSTTVDAYDSIIKELKAQGYKFVTISQLMQIAKIRGKDIGYRFNGAPSLESMQSAAGTTQAVNHE